MDNLKEKVVSMRKRGHIFVPAILAVSLAVTGCQKQETEARENKQELRLTAPSDLNSLDSSLSKDVIDFEIMTNTMEGLYRMDSKSKPELAIAKSFEVSEDGRTYTFHLRDSKWSDGKPVTAKDFEYGWKRTVDPNTKGEYAYVMFDIKNAKDIGEGKKKPEELGVKALDKNTLQVELEQPVPYFFDLLAMPQFLPIPKEVVDKQGKKYGTESNTILYNGPFVIKNWKHEQGFDLEKNKQYWDQKNVKLDQVTYNVVKEESTNVNLYDAGQIDRTFISSSFVDKYKNKSEMKTTLKNTTVFLRLNQKNEILRNENARQALSLAIDKKSLTNQILNNGSIPSDGLVPKGLTKNKEGKDFKGDNDVSLQYNVKKAQEYWEKAKSELGKQDMTLEILSVDTSDAKRTVEYISNQLESKLKGLKIKVKQQPNQQVMELRTKMEYDILLSQWGADFPDPTNFLDLFITNGSFNLTNYSNEKYDKLIEDAKGPLLLNEKKRWETMKTAETILLSEQPIVPLYQEGVTYLEKDYVKGFYIAYGVDIYKNVSIQK